MVQYRQTDGRLRRGIRTRSQIVDAHVALLRDGVLRPTAAQIAERAGVSTRTLWSSFGDMEGLLSATVAYWADLDVQLRTPVDPHLPLEDRLVRFCSDRSRRLVSIAPAALAASVHEPLSPVLQADRARHLTRTRTELQEAFGGEIASAADPEALLDALTITVSSEAWNLLHTRLNQAYDHCARVMEFTMRSLLTA
ncbi:AcrR family transcriptional regulator [Gordonia amarae]|nr:TetR/AcrR family transcriptional regulator [Gordonia amarae]MCS3879789.1 AcrR family transcriptional regulator [Gordonia amarae]